MIFKVILNTPSTWRTGLTQAKTTVHAQSCSNLKLCYDQEPFEFIDFFLFKTELYTYQCPPSDRLGNNFWPWLQKYKKPDSNTNKGTKLILPNNYSMIAW